MVVVEDRIQDDGNDAAEVAYDHKLEDTCSGRHEPRRFRRLEEAVEDPVAVEGSILEALHVVDSDDAEHASDADMAVDDQM